MKLAFYANHRYWGGLSPNGGSRTILLCCDALRKLGHEANVVTFSDKFKWFKHPKPWNRIPNGTDVVIAVSIAEVKAIWDMPYKLAYYARPFETWQKSESKCVSIMKQFQLRGGKVLVNSRWQYEYLYNKYRINAYLVHAGMDFNKWRNIEKHPTKTTVLAQYSRNPLKGYKQFKALKKLAPEFDYVVFGKTKKVTWPEIVRWYNGAHYFFVGGKREGWNNCAAEAALCGCTLVVGNSDTNGTSDFVTSENSIVYESLGEAVGRIRQGDCGNVADVQARLRAIGTRQMCMKRLVEVVQ